MKDVNTTETTTPETAPETTTPETAPETTALTVSKFVNKALSVCCDLSAEFAVLPAGEGAAVRLSTTVDNVKLFNAVNGTSENLDNYLGGEPVEVSDIIVTSADINSDMNDEESEIVNKSVVHFILTDGTHLSSMSNGIIRATKNLLSCGFNPTPESPITVKFKTVKTKRGIAHSFDLVSM